ncbi:hypothetical protein ACHAQE_010438 [Botrytis cinerea]
MFASISSLRQSSRLTAFPNKPFRFLNLPGNIRNIIYEMSVCDIKDPEPVDSSDAISLPTVETNFNINLLLTCRQIHDEAKYVLLTKNLFVEVQLTGAGKELNKGFESMLCLFRVPVVYIKQGIRPKDRSFNNCVVKYRISCDERRSQWERESIDSLVILHRHINQLFDAIAQTQWFISASTRGHSYHDIALQNPFVPMFARLGGRRSHFSIQALQNKEEAILSPFSNIAEGSVYISKDWSGDYLQRDNTITNAISSITTESVLKDLEELTSKGRDHHLQGIYVYAEEYYDLVDKKITVLMSTVRNATVTRLFEKPWLKPGDQVAEGQIFENQLAQIYSTICLYRAENALENLRGLINDGLGHSAKKVYDMVQEMAAQGAAPLQFPRFMPSRERFKNHITMNAISFRLWEEVHIGDRSCIDNALEMVERGLRIAPHDPTLKEEKYCIARRRVELVLDFSVIRNMTHSLFDDKSQCYQK